MSFAAPPSGWYRWGTAMARNRGIVLICWLLVLAVCAALYPSLKKELGAPEYVVDGSQSLKVERLLQSAGFHGAGDEQDAIIFYSATRRASDPAYRRVVARTLRAVRSQPGVQGVLSPYGAPGAAPRISSDRRLAIALVALGGSSRARFQRAEGMQSAVDRAGDVSVHALLTGASPLSTDIAKMEFADSERGEIIGVPLALGVMLLALGAVGAAGVPLALAGSAIALTSGAIALLGRVLTFDVFLLSLVTMIGLGIGIDYSMFVVSRFREELARLPPSPRYERRRVAHAVGTALATSGRTIFYSGVVVALSLTSLLVLRAPLFREFVIGSAITVASTLAAALTLLPALLAQLGGRVNAGSLPQRLQPADARAGSDHVEGGWARWARVMMRRPVGASIAVLAVLALAIAPALGLRSGIAIDVPALSHTPSGQADRLLMRSFGAGMTAPLEIALIPSSAGMPLAGAHNGMLDRRGAARPAVAAARLGRRANAQPPVLVAAQTLTRQLRGDSRVAAVAARVFPAGVLLTVNLTVPIDSPAVPVIMRRIRADLAPGIETRDGTRVLVGGWPAQSADVSHESTSKLWLVIAITLGLALLFLVAVFRSVVLPLKAVAMNLLATGAALGLVVLVFQDGHGERLLGFASPGFIQAYLPLCMFVLLFGLSMDYEIFLIRRIQEAWNRTGDNRGSVASGVEHTARPISAAAAIMVAIFGSNLTAQTVELKQFGFALAVAIAIDATLIRLVLVPALMCLLGARNWWLPPRLARVLPALEMD